MCDSLIRKQKGDSEYDVYVIEYANLYITSFINVVMYRQHDRSRQSCLTCLSQKLSTHFGMRRISL